MRGFKFFCALCCFLFAFDAARAVDITGAAGVANRKQARSKYGAKRPKAGK